MLSYGTVQASSTDKSAAAEKRKGPFFSQKGLFALIAAIAVVSLVGTLAYLREEQKEKNTMDAQASAPLNLAVLESNAVKPCGLYNGGPIAKNKQLFLVPIDNQMILQFDFTIYANSPRFGNIVHVGDDKHNEWPSVYFTNEYWRGGPKIMVRFEKQRVFGFHYVEEAITYDTEYSIRIEMQGLRCKVYLDATLKQDFTIPSQLRQSLNGGSMAVYAAADWTEPASGMVANLALCTGGALPPTSAPTEAPTTAVIATTTTTTTTTDSPSKSPTRAPTAGAPAPAPAPAHCTTFAGPQRLALDQKIMTVDIVEDYDVAFTINIDVGANSGNLFDIGGNLDDEAPRFWYYNSGSRMGIVKFRNAGGFRTEGYIDGKGLLPQGQDVDIEVQVRGLHFTVFVDGDVVLDRDMDSRSKFTRNGINVEAVDNWGLVPATISNVQYCPSCSFVFPGPQRLALDQKIGDADITDNYDVSFVINIDSGFTGSGNLIDFGGDLVNEAPRIWYYGSGSRMGIVKFRNNNGFRTEGYIDGKGLLPQGQDVKIEVKVRGLHFTVYVDGVVVLDRDMDAASKVTGKTLPVEAASHWGLVPATIKDVKLCHV